MRAALRQGLKRLRNQTSLRSFSSKKDEILSSSASYATPDSLSASSRSILYRSHMPTSPCQKTFIAVYSAFKALSDPEKGDMVAALGETTGIETTRNSRKILWVHNLNTWSLCYKCGYAAHTSILSKCALF